MGWGWLKSITKQTRFNIRVFALFLNKFRPSLVVIILSKWYWYAPMFKRMSVILVCNVFFCFYGLLFATSVNAADYAVNILWINARFDSSQKFLYPAPDEATLRDRFLRHVFEWADKTSHSGEVILWYDGVLTSGDALKNTMSIVESERLTHADWAPVYFKDIRDLPEVAGAPDVFSEQIPIYFRVDLLRLVTALSVEKKDKGYSFVYADLDMVPLSHDELFDEETNDNLREFGIVMARGGSWTFENGFQIISNYKMNLLKAIRLRGVEIGIRVGKIVSSEIEKLTGNESFDSSRVQQKVYDLYPSIFKFFYELEDWCSPGPAEKVIFLGGVLPFYPRVQSVIWDRYVFDQDGRKYPLGVTIRIPTKTVALPPSHFGGISTDSPDRITPDNYRVKLNAALKDPVKFDADLLFLAVVNQDFVSIDLIKGKLSPEIFKKILTASSKRFGKDHPKTCLEAATEGGILEFVLRTVSQ